MDEGARDRQPRAAAVLLAGGAGRRFGDPTNKVLLPLAGEPALVWSVRAVLEVPGVHRLVVVCRDEDRPAVSAALAPHLGPRDAWLVAGGAERQHSELAALRALRGEIETGEVEVVAVHDAARPLASPQLWVRALAAAAEHGGALPVTRLPGLVPAAAGADPLPPVMTVQTPQAFRAAPLLAAYDAAAADGFVGTDTAACVEAYADLPVVAVPGEATNLKLTWSADLPVLERLLSDRLRR